VRPRPPPGPSRVLPGGAESALELTVQRSAATAYSVESTVGPDGAESAAGAIDAVRCNLRARLPPQRVPQGSHAWLSNTNAPEWRISSQSVAIHAYSMEMRFWQQITHGQRGHHRRAKANIGGCGAQGIRRRCCRRRRCTQSTRGMRGWSWTTSSWLCGPSLRTRSPRPLGARPIPIYCNVLLAGAVAVFE
jgi:hypothetical protein